MLTDSKKLLKDAKNNGVALPAFNIDNLESALAVAQIVKKYRLPVIVQTIPRTLKYGGISTYPAIMRELLADCDVAVCMHLDHGDSLETVEKCVKSGFTSVMFDGSALPFAENVTQTLLARKIAENVSLEAELGAIGGKEQGDTDLEISYTKVTEAVEFTQKTNVDSLAVGVGSCHGIYKGEPNINVKRIREISEAVATPLVLHGASGIPESTLKECIAAGITKINFATELRQAFTRGVKIGLEKYPDAFDPKIYLPIAVAEIAAVAESKLKICYGIK